VLRLIRDDHVANQRRSLGTREIQCRHLRDHFRGDGSISEITTSRIERYVAARRSAGAAASSIRGELSHLARALKLAARASLIAHAQIPYVPQIRPDPSRIRQGFITRSQLDDVCFHLDVDSADFVRFLFFSAWRSGEARGLRWRDYDPSGPAFCLRADASKTGQPRLLPVAGDLAPILDGDQRRAMAISGHRTVATFHRYQIAGLVSLKQVIEMAASPDKRATPPALENSPPPRERTQKVNSRAETQRG
jgi:integrase